MKGMNPNRWRPERPASIGCALRGYIHEHKGKEDMMFERIADEEVRKIALFKSIEQKIKMEMEE